jgi:hypothetical protein
VARSSERGWLGKVSNISVSRPLAHTDSHLTRVPCLLAILSELFFQSLMHLITPLISTSFFRAMNKVWVIWKRATLAPPKTRRDSRNLWTWGGQGDILCLTDGPELFIRRDTATSEASWRLDPQKVYHAVFLARSGHESTITAISPGNFQKIS